MNGVLSTGWTVAPLGDLARVYSGGTPPRDVPAYWGGGIPWVTTAEIDAGFVTSTRETITEAGLRASAANLAPPGALLVAMYGQGKTRGKATLLRIPAATNQACAAIEVGRRLDSHYLLYYLESRYREIRSMSNAGSQENLSGELVRLIPISVPPIQEQCKIADLLSDADGLITSLERMIAKKEAVKQGMMQQLLTGKTRLPGFTEPWRRSTIADLAQIVSGGTPKSSVPSYWDGNIAWCTPTDITRSSGRFLCHTERTISLAGLEHSAARLLPAGSLLLCTRATIGEVKIAVTPITTNQGFKSLVPCFQASGEYLYYKIMSLKDDLAAKGTGSTFLEVSKRDVAELTFEAPSPDEQAAIASALDEADDEIMMLQKRLDKARAVKRGMMQELLTGRTRLPVAEGDPVQT